MFTWDVWASHGGTADGGGSSVGSSPCWGDVHSGGEDVNTWSVVGEGSSDVTAVGGTDRDSLEIISSIQSMCIIYMEFHTLILVIDCE